jgi:hypothetical protein
VARPFDLPLQLGALRTIQFDGGAAQPPVGPAGDRRYHLQLAQQLGGTGCCRRRLALPLDLEKQLRSFQDSLADGWGSVTPSGIQLSGFAAGETIPSQCFGHAPAVFGARARHRHQILHRDVGAYDAVPHLLLHAGRKQLDQGEPT